MYILIPLLVLFFNQNPAYELRISDWNSDVFSSDLCRLSDQLSARGARPLSRHDHARAGRLPRLAQVPAAIRKPPPRRPAAGGELHGRGCAPPDPHEIGSAHGRERLGEER